MLNVNFVCEAWSVSVYPVPYTNVNVPWNSHGATKPPVPFGANTPETPPGP